MCSSLNGWMDAGWMDGYGVARRWMDGRLDGHMALSLEFSASTCLYYASRPCMPSCDTYKVIQTQAERLVMNCGINYKLKLN